MNSKVYIHEFVDIIGHNRSRYMHHITANWSPIAQDERGQQCFGVWGVVGSTGRWPQVVNIWEEDGWDGLGRSFAHELGHAELQDPKLARWWSAAAGMRSGGLDRILVPAPWMPTIAELCEAGAGGIAYAHDQAVVAPGEAGDYLDLVRDEGESVYASVGWKIVGAWQTALGNESEAFVLWSIPSWRQWSDAERELRGDGPLGKWRLRHQSAPVTFSRILLVDSPLSPLRTRRQPRREDRDQQWEE